MGALRPRSLARTFAHGFYFLGLGGLGAGVVGVAGVAWLTSLGVLVVLGQLGFADESATAWSNTPSIF
jgi:hypothetical protein